MLVHLAYTGIGFPGALDDLIKHYTRFAAGGFVFLAGLTVASVFGPGVERSLADRWQVYLKLWRRAAFLVAADVAASVAYRLLDLWRTFPVDPDTPLSQALLSILLLQRPGLTGGILLLYAVLLSMMPAVFAVQLRLGSWAVAFASAALYGAAIHLDGTLFWPPYGFPVAYWQPLFFAGFLSVHWYRRACSAGVVPLCLWATAAGALFAIVFLAQYGPWLGVVFVAQTLPLSFDKTPLQLGALLWYLSIVQVVIAAVSLVWNRLLACTWAAEGLALLGRNSLLVYAAHVFTEVLVMEYIWSEWPPASVRVGLAVADIVLLGMLCTASENALHVQLWRWLTQRDRRIAWRRRALAAAVVCTIVLATPLGRDTEQLDMTDLSLSLEADYDAEISVLEVSSEGPPDIDEPMVAPPVEGTSFEQLLEEPLESSA